MADAYDVIVIGGGHNGLVTAALLAGKGLRVLVLERRGLVGGGAVTEEIFPGFKVSAASYLVSLLQQKVVDELELERLPVENSPSQARNAPAMSSAGAASPAASGSATASCG